MEKVVVTQAENQPEVTAEVIAQSIVRMDEGVKKLLNSGLKMDAIVVLLKDSTGYSKALISDVLHGLNTLRRDYTTK